MTIYLRKAGQQNEQSNGFHTRKMKKTLNSRTVAKTGWCWLANLTNLKIYRLTAVNTLTQVEINAMWSGLLIWTARNALVPPYGPWTNLIGCFMMR